MGLENVIWGGSGIEKCLFDFIAEKIPAGSTVIELGSGACSTQALSSIYTLYSIEDNGKFVNAYNGSTYINAPLVNGWYDRDIVSKNTPTEYSLVFVDGPAGEGNRSGLLNNLDLFDSNAVFIFHDIYRAPERQLALDVAAKLNKTVTFYEEGDYWAVVE